MSVELLLLCLHIGHMYDSRVLLQVILREAPGSIRELAREAGVSHGLLLAIRNGERRLTPATREALVAVLRSWSKRCATLADDLEAANLGPDGGDYG